MHAAAAEARCFADRVEAGNDAALAAEHARVEIGLEAAERLAGEDVELDRDQRSVCGIEDLVAAMNKLADSDLLKLEHVRMQIEARDREIANPYVKDAQVMNIHNARRYIGDRLIRTAPPHRILDPEKGPLIAVKLNILTRKTLGGLQTDLTCRVLRADGTPLPGLYAAGEVAGFGGGGVHGYRSLEGTFLGGCLFSGRQAGRSAALAVV